MKRIPLTIAGILLCISHLFAQGPKIEKSVAFDEPANGWNKVLLLKNGNTFFFHFTKRDGIEVMVFDPKRKKIASKELTSDLWDSRKLKSTVILGLYEINGEPVLFMQQPDEKTPVLYRLRFNPAKGNIVKEEEVGRMPKLNFVQELTMQGLGKMGIFVEKDPQSDCYAVIYFNGAAEDKDDRIKVVHYDGNHKPINVAYYESPDDDFKELNLIGAVVDGNKRVYISTYGASNKRGRDGHVFVARLNVGDSVFTNKTLDFTEDFRNTTSIMIYNHTNNTIDLLTQTVVSEKMQLFTDKHKVSYLSFLSFIDPETLELKSVKPLEAQKINEYAHNTLQTDRDYHGLPQQMIVNKDNSITILSEETVLEVIRSGRITSIKTLLGNIGMSELNEDGTEKKGCMIMKKQTAGGVLPPLYISARSKGRWFYQRDGYVDVNSYLSYDYVNTDKGRYIIFNDNPKNFDKDEDEGSRKAVTKVDKLDAICYSLDGDNIKKSFLFGNPESKKESSSCFIEASDYQPANNTYATVMIARDGRDREAKMVWLTFE